METQDEVREVKVHAISLRRPRSRKRGSAASAVSAGPTSRVVGTAWGMLSQVTEPPRQSWLAMLGLSSFVVKNTTSAWKALVQEGTSVETALRRRVTAGSRGHQTARGKASSRPSHAPADG